MNDSPTRPLPGDPLRTLVAFEVAVRNLDILYRRVLPIVDQMQRQHAEITADLLSELIACDFAELVTALQKLRGAIEAEEKRGG
jgi:hypothetical protein